MGIGNFVDTSRDAITCGDPSCEIHDKMNDLAGTLEPPPDDEANRLIDAFIATYRDLLLRSPDDDRIAPQYAFAGLFDLVVTGKYAQRFVDTGDWTYCEGHWGEDGALFFPFFNVCPRCSGVHDELPKVETNKPQSSVIGDVCESTTFQIFSKLTPPSVTWANSSNRQGDVDIIIYDDDIVALGELKSSPLTLFPPMVMWDDASGEAVGNPPANDHTVVDPDVTSDELQLFVAHQDWNIPLGPKDNPEWPFPELSDYFNEPDHVESFVHAWEELYDVYVNERGKWNDTDPRRWLNCGCGGTPDNGSGSVDDTKNAPGLDRTDDIKKATYQALKYVTSYRDKCSEDRIRSVLVSNFLPVLKWDRYMEDMVDVILTKPKYEVSDESTDSTTSFNSDNIYPLYDGVICLTESIYHDEHLESVTSYEQFLGDFLDD